MPTYGYRCTACGTEFDLWQSMRDDARADCPTCGAPAKRLFFPAGIVFKGAGFYKTDSRGGSGSSSSGTSPAATAADSSAASGDGAGSAPAKASSPARDSAGTTSSAGSSTSTAATPAKTSD